MDLVVYRGAQYDAAKLPTFVDPAECVPLAEWLSAHARRPRAGGAPSAPGGGEPAAAAKPKQSSRRRGT